MSGLSSRVLSVCLVVALAVSLLAVGPGATGAGSDDRWSATALQTDADGPEDDDDADEEDDENEDDEHEERDDEDDDGEGGEEGADYRAELDEERAEFEAEKRELEAERRELEAEGEWAEAKDEWQAEMQELREEWDEERAEILAELDCNESDHDRGHGNDCDGADEDNPGNGGPAGDDADQPEDSNPLEQADPTPTPTLTPAPTTTPESTTASPSPSPTPTPTATPSAGGASGSSDGTGPPDDADETPDGVSSASSSHEIGGFQPIRSVSVNRTTVTAGEWVEIVVTVENVNDEPIAVPVELAVFGEVVAVESVSVPGESTERVRFVQKFDAPGTYHPSVGDHEATVRVEPRSGTVGEETTVPTGQVGFGALAALVAFGLLVLASGRR